MNIRQPYSFTASEAALLLKRLLLFWMIAFVILI